MRKHRIVTASALALALLLAWWFWPHSDAVAPAVERAANAAAGEASVDARLEPASAPARAALEDSIAAPAPAPASAPDLASTPARDALGELVVRVVEANSARPIPNARVQLTFLRRADQPGGASLWPGHVPGVATTDADGIAHLSYPAWVTDAGRSSAVGWFASHAEYPSAQDEIELTGLRTEATIELVLGCYVVVSGWIDAPSNVVRDVRTMLEGAAAVASADWVRGRDGRLGTNRLAPGEHALAIAWEAPDGRMYSSRVVEFALAAGEQREFALELVPCRALRGRLDAAVPRPVIDGVVRVNFVFGSKLAVANLRTFGANVAADGTFAIPQVPPGAIELIALCEGWAATPRLVAPLASEAETSGQPARRASWSVPEFEPVDDSPIVVPMTPTAAVELELVDEAGASIAGAEFWMFPNVHWPSSGIAEIYLDRKWFATTDARGRARLANVPAHAPPCEESYGVSKSGYVPLEGGSDGKVRGRVAIEPGATTALRVVMRRATE